MNILTIGNFTTGWDGSICDEEHIAHALELFGHKVTRWQREETTVALPTKPPFDFILMAQWDNYNMETLRNLKASLKCPLVYWAFDYQADGQEWHDALVDVADMYLSKRIADSRYPHWQWLSQDFAPSFLDRVFKPGQEKPIDVLFTGSYLPWATERNEILKAVDDKFNLRIHTVTPDPFKQLGFKNVNGPVMDDQLPFLISKAKINLSIDHTLEAGYWSDRNAQIMACGGLVLFRYVPLSEAVFGDMVVYFYDKEDCISRILQLLERPSEDLERVADMGYDHAQENLMVQNRVRNLLTIVELKVIERL